MPKRTHDGIKKRCDCGRRQWPKCSHPWHFSFHHNGQEHRYSLDVIARARNGRPPESKAEAIGWRDRLRSEIRAGTFVDPTAPPLTAAVAPDTRLTFGDICDTYLKGHVGNPTRREEAQGAMRWAVRVIRSTEIPGPNGSTVRLESKPMADLTAADIEAFRDARRAILVAGRARIEEAVALERRAAVCADPGERAALDQQALALRRSVRARPGHKGGEVGINRLLARLRHICTWAVKQRHIPSHPFKFGGEVVVELETSAENARTRRLAPGEEDRLLGQARPHLRSLIVAALTTGCRLGELLSLQWSQVRFDDKGQARWLELPAGKTKTKTTRLIPVGTRLRAELEMRRYDPDGKEHTGDRFVFGNECGEEVARITTAWRATCRRAGISNLHFHDLRREFASRLMESGAEQHAVRDFLGHANITTTSRYLKSTPLHLERALRALEQGDGFAHHSHTDANQRPPAEVYSHTPTGQNQLIQ